MRVFAAKAVCLAILALTLSACAAFMGMDQRKGVSSSLVDYLYPDGEIPTVQEGAITQLKLPLTVGLAFVPAQGGSAIALPEAQRTQLLERVKQRFLGLDYIREINVIPESYMRTNKGFEGVEQIARLYGLDAIALVSYDQVAITSERKSSVLYWTIVGSYFIKGNENEATTFVDTAVFDVNSRKLLFRAPGVSEISENSTLIEADSVNRANRAKGFELAMADMTNNLEAELDTFKDKIKTDDSLQVASRDGYEGAGAVQWPLLCAILGGLVLLRVARR